MSALSDLDKSLMEAVNKNDVGAIKNLLAEGADPDARYADGTTLLHKLAFASNKVNIEIAGILLDNGADINAQTRNGTAPLHSAVYGYSIRYNSDMVSFLLERGADATVRNFAGGTPLDAAKIYSPQVLADIFYAHAKKNIEVKAKYADEEENRLNEKVGQRLELLRERARKYKSGTHLKRKM